MDQNKEKNDIDLRPIQISNSDGSLLKGVKLSLNHTVEKLKEGWKPSVFASCFPSLAGRYEKQLLEVRMRSLNPLVDALYSDLSTVVEENLADPLNELNGIIKKQNFRQNSIAWRPSGDPEKDMIAHDIKVLQYEKQKLLVDLEAHRKNKEKLLEAVKSGRQKCQSNSMILQKQLKRLQPIGAVCKKLTTEELERNFELEIENLNRS